MLLLSVIIDSIPVIAMNFVAKHLFDFLHNVIYDQKNAFLEVEKLPEDFQDFGRGLQFFANGVLETKALAMDLSSGNLACKLPSRHNEMAAPLKSLHASLKHLTWQTQQIAQGDYRQRVGFMGEFSDAFNKMIEQLAERQQKLEDKINKIQDKTSSLEQSNLLLTALVHYIPQQIIVIDINTNEILFLNDIAANEINNDADYLKDIIQHISGSKELENGHEVDFTYTKEETLRYFLIKAYFFEWNNSNAKILAISDVSATKNKIEELKTYAYRDSVTNLYNRTFGMLMLDRWLHEKIRFVLIFADLDGLKHVNDEFGHKEGDVYIMNAAKHLKTFSPDAVVCRIGGDEFMLLAAGISYDEAYVGMSKIYQNFQSDKYLKNKTYSYSISFGIAAVETKNKLSASDILSIADERMYENKRMRKRARQK